MIKSGFFDSINEDRPYTATDVGSLFHGIIADGVISGYGGGMVVSELNPTGMGIFVNTGKAWCHNSFITVVTPETIVVPDADWAHPRIDTIAVDFDSSNAARANTIVLIQGTPDSNPVPATLIDDANAGHYQHPLARISVGAGVTEITQSDITNTVGTSECPFASGTLQQYDAGELFLQYQARFDTWFNNLVDELSTTQVTNLQGQIDELTPRLDSGRNVIENGAFKVFFANGGFPGWTMEHHNVSWFWQTHQRHTSDGGVGRSWFQFWKLGNAAQTSTYSDSYMAATQQICLSRLRQSMSGTTEARPFTLSFWVESPIAGTFTAQLVMNQLHAMSLDFTVHAAKTAEYITLQFPPITSAQIDYAVAGQGAIAYDQAKLSIIVIAGSDYSGGGAQDVWHADTQDRTATENTALMGVILNPGYSDLSFELSDVQLEFNDEPTPFEYEEDEYLFTVATRRRGEYRSRTIGVGDATGYVQVDIEVDLPAGINTDNYTYNLYDCSVYINGTWEAFNVMYNILAREHRWIRWRIGVLGKPATQGAEYPVRYGIKWARNY